MNRALKESFIGLCVFAGVVGLIAIVFTNTPIVKISYSTKQCVEVISRNPAYNCKNLPKKYARAWVY